MIIYTKYPPGALPGSLSAIDGLRLVGAVRRGSDSDLYGLAVLCSYTIVGLRVSSIQYVCVYVGFPSSSLGTHCPGH